jgi:hypothetical protein
LTGTCGIDSLEEIAYPDGVDDVDTTIKGVMSPRGTVTTGSGATAANSRKNGISVSVRAVENLKLCAYYLKHMERVRRKPAVNTVNLALVRSYPNQQRHEVSFKKTVEEPRLYMTRTGPGPLKTSRSTSLPSMEEQGLIWFM